VNLIESAFHSRTQYSLIGDQVGKPHSNYGNQLNDTGPYSWLLKRDLLLGKVDSQEYAVERQRILKAHSPFETSYGLFSRTPKKEYNPQNHEDYGGLALTSHCLHPELSRRVVAKGIELMWFMNDRNPGSWRLRSWLGRYPHIIAMHYQAATHQPGSLGLVWAEGNQKRVTVLGASKDGWKRAWMCNKVLGPWMHDETNTNFYTAFKKKWPHGIGNLYRSYGWSKEHVLVKHGWDVF